MKPFNEALTWSNTKGMKNQFLFSTEFWKKIPGIQEPFFIRALP